MAYVIVEEAPSEVFHYTKRGNLDSILRDRTIRRFSDTECWFCLSLKDTLACMQQTVMDEGKPSTGMTARLGSIRSSTPVTM